MTVRVYFNLHRKCLSIQHKTPHGWRVWRYANKITLSNVLFKVSEAGRQRVIREQKKNVHAYVEGDLITGGMIPPSCMFKVPVSYNPYLTIGKFYNKESGDAVDTAKFASIKDRNILIVS